MQGGVRWDRKAPPESNLHVYGKDDIEFRVHNVKRSPKRGDRKNIREKVLKNKLIKKKGGFWTKLIHLSCSGYTEDKIGRAHV